MYRGKNTVYKFIKSILNEYNYCRKVIKKHLNKNLIMSAEEEERFQLSNICWICNKLFDVSDNKVRDISLENIEMQHIEFLMLILK